MSDTPETERYVKMRASLAYCIDRDAADFARRLERERDEARREREALIQKHRETKCEFCGMIPLTEKELEWIKQHGHE